MYEFFRDIDRRWIFLLMFLSVAVPILLQMQFPEKPSGLAAAVFEEIESLNEGDRVLLAFDFDPASEGELGPMATTLVLHCCEKKLKMYFMALWPVGEQMITDNINKVIRSDFPELVEHQDFVNLGFKAGNEGVIKVVITDLGQLYTTDANGTALSDIPMMDGINNIQQMDLMCNVSAGYPGTKEWVQYAVTAYPDDIRLVAGCTGVQAPLLYPYIPQQLPGLLAAIKGASEYEKLVLDKYGENIMIERDGVRVIPGKYLEGQRRMGPQLVAHILMILLIIAGNVIFFVGRKREGDVMKRENLVWIVFIAIGVLFVGGRTLMMGGVGKAYVRAVPTAVDAANPDGQWKLYEQSTPVAFAEAQDADPNQTTYSLSIARTMGIWIAALFTLFILSFLIKDNPFYKIAESCVVGVSAAYWMVIGFWTTLVPNLIGKLSPDLVRNWAVPGLDSDEQTEWLYLVPLILGIMLLWRLAPKGGWISRWPMAFIIGVFCGLRFISFLHADFMSQIRNGIVPLWVVTDGSFDFWGSLRSVFLIVGVLSCLVYFFFSIEHKGVVGHTARLGIWFLMITFGAAFGYTVMGRIALLAIRVEFLFDDWLWLIDPTGKRVVDVVSMLM